MAQFLILKSLNRLERKKMQLFCENSTSINIEVTTLISNGGYGKRGGKSNMGISHGRTFPPFTHYDYSAKFWTSYLGQSGYC